MSSHLLDVEAGEPKRKGAVQRMMILRTGEGKSKTRCRAVACMSICQKGATATTTEEDNRKSTRWKSEYQAAPRQRRCDEILREYFGEASVKVFFGNNSHRWPHYLVITVKFNDVVTSIKTYSEVFRQTHFGHWFRLNMNIAISCCSVSSAHPLVSSVVCIGVFSSQRHSSCELCVGKYFFALALQSHSCLSSCHWKRDKLTMTHFWNIT